jgi:hypothetical protein
MWMLRYAPNNNQEFKNKPFVDFCFDSIIDDIDEIIEEQKQKITDAERFHEKKQDIDKKKLRLAGLEYLKNITRSKSREHYYIDDKELSPDINVEYAIFNKPDKEFDFSNCVNNREFYIRMLIHKIDEYLSPFISYFDSVGCLYREEVKVEAHLISHGEPNEIFEKARNLGVPTINLFRGENVRNIIDSHKKNIMYSIGNKKIINQTDIAYIFRDSIPSISTYDNKSIRENWLSSYCERFPTFKDIEPLIKLGKLFIEVIEFLRPDIVTKYNELN